MNNEQSKWMQMQTNQLSTAEDKLQWTIERLNWIKTITSSSKGENLILKVKI